MLHSGRVLKRCQASPAVAAPPPTPHPTHTIDPAHPCPAHLPSRLQLPPPRRWWSACCLCSRQWSLSGMSCQSAVRHGLRGRTVNTACRPAAAAWIQRRVKVRGRAAPLLLGCRDRPLGCLLQRGRRQGRRCCCCAAPGCLPARATASGGRCRRRCRCAGWSECPAAAPTQWELTGAAVRCLEGRAARVSLQGRAARAYLQQSGRQAGTKHVGGAAAAGLQAGHPFQHTTAQHRATHHSWQDSWKPTQACLPPHLVGSCLLSGGARTA